MLLGGGGAGGRLTYAAGRVLVRALGVRPELAVLVAAGVGVLRAEEAGVALLVALDAQVAAERLLGLGEAAARLGEQHLADEPQAARRELLVVDVVARHGVRVHQVGAALAGRGGALGRVGVVLAAPVVAELVRRHQVRLASDDAAERAAFKLNVPRDAREHKML